MAICVSIIKNLDINNFSRWRDDLVIHNEQMAEDDATGRAK